MIRTQSDDPDVTAAAAAARRAITDTLAHVPEAKSFDYGGHELKLGDYGLCTQCTRPIAEAQAAETALRHASARTEDEVVREHLELAAQLFHAEAEAAVARAELHNGHGTEGILNDLLTFMYQRGINEPYEHSHHRGREESAA